MGSNLRTYLLPQELRAWNTYTQRQLYDTIEFGAITRGNGFRHLTSGKYLGHAHGCMPEWHKGGYYTQRGEQYAR
jgi:hypothetical protein